LNPIFQSFSYISKAIPIILSELYENGKYNIDGKGFTTEELIEYYDELINKYPNPAIFIASIIN